MAQIKKSDFPKRKIAFYYQSKKIIVLALL